MSYAFHDAARLIYIAPLFLPHADTGHISSLAASVLLPSFPGWQMARDEDAFSATNQV